MSNEPNKEKSIKEIRSDLGWLSQIAWESVLARFDEETLERESIVEVCQGIDKAIDELATWIGTYRAELTAPLAGGDREAGESVVVKIVKTIEQDLNDRRGLHLDTLPTDIKRQVRQKWYSLLNPIIAAARADVEARFAALEEATWEALDGWRDATILLLQTTIGRDDKTIRNRENLAKARCNALAVLVGRGEGVEK